MEAHLKHGLIFAMVFTAFFWIQHAVAFAGAQIAFLQTVIHFSSGLFYWVMDLIGLSGCQALAHLFLYIFIAIFYYPVIGFVIGSLSSVLLEAIISRKPSK